jgi:hypothetical protein
MLLAIPKAMGFENLNALIVDHLCWSSVAVCESLERLGVEHEYADSFGMVEVLIASGNHIYHKGYDMIITETAMPASYLVETKQPVEAAAGAGMPQANADEIANSMAFPVGPKVVRLARSQGQNPFVIAHYDKKEDAGLWTPGNPCDCLLARSEAIKYEVLEKILREMFGS